MRPKCYSRLDLRKGIFLKMGCPASEQIALKYFFFGIKSNIILSYDKIWLWQNITRLLGLNF